MFARAKGEFVYARGILGALSRTSADREENAVRRGPDGKVLKCGVDEPGELLREILDHPKQPAARFDGYADDFATRAKILRNVFHPGDAWFRTGDLLRQDACGYYYFVDRVDDTFRWKRENVSTTEVAETLMLFRDVDAAIVYGVCVPGAEGRARMAAIVARDVASFDLDGLRAHVHARPPAYARPRFLRFRRDLDQTGAFKPKKTELVGEGYDIGRVDDPIVFGDRERGYLRLDGDLHRRLFAGEVRL